MFAIDVCAYAVLNNQLCPEQLEGPSDDDVRDRWWALFKGPLPIQRYRAGEDLKPFERSTVSDIVIVWRSMLSSISCHALPEPAYCPSGETRGQV